MWVTSIDNLRTTHIQILTTHIQILTTHNQILTTLAGNNTQISHGAVKIEMLQHWMDKVKTHKHLVFINIVKGKSISVMIQSLHWTHWLRSILQRMKKLCRVKLYHWENWIIKWDCSHPRKKHFKKIRHPTSFSKSKSRKWKKPYRFFRKRSFSSKEQGRKKSSRCFICGKKGYYAKDCPNKKEKAIRLVKQLQVVTEYSAEKKEVES